MTNERIIAVTAGPHGQDGVELELFTRRLIAVRLKGQAERAKTTLLTKEQAERLREALDELIETLEDGPTASQPEGPATLLAA